jgi:TldD protein
MRAAACFLAAAAIALAQQPADVELKAMHDELERSRTISLPNLERPYFVQYLIDESETFGLAASLGGVLSSRSDKFRSAEVRVRVGDYSFDNTNYTGAGFAFGTRYDLERFPLRDDYDVLRRYLWLQTDSAYKSAVEAISRKRAALRNITQNERINDLAHAQAVQHLRAIPALKIDTDYWTKRVRSASALFAQYPEVKNSSVELEAATGGYTLVNTEGAEVREPQTVHYLRLRALAQAADGMTLRDATSFYSLDLMHLPDEAEITRGVKALAENVVALAHAPKGDDYSGPVLFEGVAGPQIFAELLGRNLGLARRPVSDGGRGGGFQPSELEGRIGARVLPDSFDVVDDPTQTDWRGRQLLGHYEVDLEGVAPVPVKVVEKGALKNYLLTRQPVRGYEGSNGHARLPGNFGADSATFSNLFVRSSATVPVADLKKKLMEICQARGKPYGMLVRKMDFPSSAPLDEARRMIGGGQGGRPVSMPLAVYRVYPDGREELVRAVRFRGLNLRSLKDILAAGDDSTMFEYMDNGAPFALLAASGATAESAVIAPSILVDDLELHPVEDEQPKLPLVTAPELTVK